MGWVQSGRISSGPSPSLSIHGSGFGGTQAASKLVSCASGELGVLQSPAVVASLGDFLKILPPLRM